MFSCWALLFALSIGLTGLLAPSAASAQKANSCDRELRDSSRVFLKTPLEVSSGKVCLDDGDSFGIGNAWVRLSGIDAPEVERNCLKVFDPLPPRCMRSKAAIDSLLLLSELLEAGAVCTSDKKGHINRWPADCTTSGGKNMALEMISRGFACATNSSPDDYKTADLEARKRKAGLWADVVGGKPMTFPSKQCSQSTQRYKSHVRYLERKARKAAAAGQ